MARRALGRTGPGRLDGNAGDDAMYGFDGHHTFTESAAFGGSGTHIQGTAIEVFNP